jgi:hypothetical protein
MAGKSEAAVGLARAFLPRMTTSLSIHRAKTQLDSVFSLLGRDPTENLGKYKD